MSWYKKADFRGRDPYSVDFVYEEEKARGMSEDELIGALSDAIETAKVSVNQGKYTDQASVYRKELISRGMSIPEQDLKVKATPSLHSRPVENQTPLDKRELAIKLMEWHGGQNSSLYSVGSSWLSGNDVPAENIKGAISELQAELRSTQQPNSLTPPEDSGDLTTLISALTKELQTMDEMETDRHSYEAEMGRDTHKGYGDGYQSPEDTGL